MNEAEARAYCAERLDAEAMGRLDRLALALREENGRQNLVSSASLNAIWQRHFADSIQLLDYLPPDGGVVLDLGSGAGFPGLPLAIARPDRRLILVESRKRRVEWLERCAQDLDLANVDPIGTRLESLEQLSAGAITARAFAPLDKLLRLSARFSTPDTVWLLPKGRSAAQELAHQPASIQRMFHVEQSMTDADSGILIGRGVPPHP
ncbi:MAG: 16S rRNA (guanine(527)-N(7))-methyltransferase RsmG [Croceibacterium sp.]